MTKHDLDTRLRRQVKPSGWSMHALRRSTSMRSDTTEPSTPRMSLRNPALKMFVFICPSR